jgi:hypothetical protein
MFHLFLQFISLQKTSKEQSYYGATQSVLSKLNNNLQHTISSSMSSSSGTCGGLKKLKKLSQVSVLVIGFAFFEPFLGFFLRIFWVMFFPGYHSISVLQHRKEHVIDDMHTYFSHQ